MMTVNKNDRRHVMKNNFWMLRQVWKYTPGYLFGMVSEGVAWGMHHAIGIIYLQILLDALGEGASMHAVVRIITCFLIYNILFYIFHHWYWGFYNPKIREKLQISMHTEMFRQSVAIDLARYDDPDFYNDFIWAMDQSVEHAIGLMEDTGKLINRIVGSVALTGVLFCVDTMIAVIIFGMAAVHIGVTILNNRLNLKYHTELNPLERKEAYVKRVFKLPDYAKELRTTHVTENLFDSYQTTMDTKRQVIRNYGKRVALLAFVRNGMGTIGECAVIVRILYKVLVTGEVSLGGFAVAVNASWKMVWFLDDMVERLLKYHEHGIFFEKMIRFLEDRPKITDGSLVAEDFDSLELKDVSFAYGTQDSEKYALQHVDLKIRRGEKIAIVGYNGAGKTTLTKLLMRLYDPDSGEILYNGRNIKEYTLESLREQMAAVFQDYRIFASSVAENVAGGPFNEQEEKRVREALEKSTFAGKLEKLPNGIKTQLTREFDNSGTQLSGGEQQKVAIARAFYKNAALIILDEPSSALDPDAEYALNQALCNYADTRTVIFISHRLSTTRDADRIYMFDSGRLIEQGTHEELIAADGKYAYMFNLQAEKYREEAAG